MIFHADAAARARTMTAASLGCAADIAILTTDQEFAHRIRRVLADERTRVHVDLSGPTPRTHDARNTYIPDVVVLDVRSRGHPARDLQTVRQRWPTTSVLVVNVKDEREVSAWLDLGADDACETHIVEAVGRFAVSVIAVTAIIVKGLGVVLLLARRGIKDYREFVDFLSGKGGDNDKKPP